MGAFKIRPVMILPLQDCFVLLLQIIIHNQSAKWAGMQEASEVISFIPHAESTGNEMPFSSFNFFC